MDSDNLFFEIEKVLIYLEKIEEGEIILPIMIPDLHNFQEEKFICKSFCLLGLIYSINHSELQSLPKEAQAKAIKVFKKVIKKLLEETALM